mmetsp:Transcript_21864/g.36656  ORF Transcript_21864/g.36656 Transcript_21864/m.36656 type:complete len:224 (-) Transcript_21864:435-1106(-)
MERDWLCPPRNSERVKCFPRSWSTAATVVSSWSVEMASSRSSRRSRGATRPLALVSSSCGESTRVSTLSVRPTARSRPTRTSRSTRPSVPLTTLRASLEASPLVFAALPLSASTTGKSSASSAESTSAPRPSTGTSQESCWRSPPSRRSTSSSTTARLCRLPSTSPLRSLLTASTTLSRLSRTSLSASAPASGSVIASSTPTLPTVSTTASAMRSSPSATSIV